MNSTNQGVDGIVTGEFLYFSTWTLLAYVFCVKVTRALQLAVMKQAASSPLGKTWNEPVEK